MAAKPPRGPARSSGPPAGRPGADPSPRTRAVAGERAVLDNAEAGDIQGAFGTIREHDTEGRRGLRSRGLALLAIASAAVALPATARKSGFMTPPAVEGL